MSSRILIESDRLNVWISPLGGAIVEGRTVEGMPFLRPYKGNAKFDVADGACFPLVPLGNRVENNAFSFGGRTVAFARNADDPLYIHGDGWLGAWAVEECRADHVELAFDKQQSAVSPYAYHVRQSFRLLGARLELLMSVTNTGGVTLPFGLGFHPFFPRTPLTTLLAQAQAWWTEGDGHLPASRGAIAEDVDFSTARPLPDSWLNNCCESWNGVARIVWPERRLGVHIKADSALDRYMLYAPDQDKSYFCFEPMSHTPNALRHVDADTMGLKLLAPGETLSAGFTMTVFDWSDDNG
ncbi:aldose 1-epimerase [Mesorhizobium sp. B3-2-1]|uniref:aldose 1-epimerase n=1 Tax=Mesorhizobium sp. B3-2-1 TaxID=2589891 RepID=UPI0011286A80|nr:aldose 1-epimerase [Mesorhizobium sp. B3-2-1]TPI35171.1 aldose 1-epimerase [Mesorhizobium sp. B3-2-1]